jgi:NAD(P)-dependent dehydrogenase (short-subunit alcohol dehydrogenase family)
MSTPGKDDPAGAALVTGSARRIGREIALALARDGWDVAIHHGRSRAEADATVGDVQALGRRAIAVSCDLSDEREVRALLPACERGLGAIACLVNNASVFEPDDAGTFGWPRLESHMRVNVAAAVLLARELHARLPAGGRGVVVNLLDQKLWNPNPDFLSYTLSKAALQAATDLLARALAPQVRVVGVAPGITLPAAGQSGPGFDTAHRLTPLGRSSTAEDIGRAVAFLARSPAVTGTTLLVDGGQHLVPSARDVMFLTERA